MMSGRYGPSIVSSADERLTGLKLTVLMAQTADQSMVVGIK
jgi:hypothetical protein